MASDNLMTMDQPWQFRPTFSDAWISDIFNKETETLTKVLQNSFSNTTPNDDVLSTELIESLFAQPEVTPIQTPTVSGGSENDASFSKHRRSLPPSGRVAKRKSRASKRETTTFITADPANFRQMVQQVTGVRLGGSSGEGPVAAVLKPEPQRMFNRLQVGGGGGGGLPTLDASGFFVDGSVSSFMAQFPPPSLVVDNGGAAGNGVNFDSFCSFPTLESWKVI